MPNAQAQTQTLGLAMIAQNEEAHIPAAIAQFYHVVQDIVLVDGGSSDATVAWAQRMGARVLHRPFDNDFSAQKNFAISEVQADWIYLHDPDERLEPTLIELLPYLITREGQSRLMELDIIPPNASFFDCFGIARKNFIDGELSAVYPDYQYRLFRRYCRFEGKVHEKIVGFKNRTEIDYTRPNAARPEEKPLVQETERGQLYQGINASDPQQTARFNILHYKTSATQQRQDVLYRKISEGV